MYNYEYLTRLQDQTSITNKDISEHTGISESTVWRILTGNAKSPQYENIRDICIYLGGSLDEMEGLPLRMAAPISEEKACSLPSYIDYRHYIEMRLTLSLHLHRQSIWLTVLVAMNIVLMGFIMGLFAYDIMHPDRGWIQYMQSISHSRLRDAFRSIVSASVKV